MWPLNISILASLFWAAGYRIDLAILVAGYGIPQLLGKLTVILGGVGVVEASMVGLYTLFRCAKAQRCCCCPGVSTLLLLHTDAGRDCAHSVS